MILTRQRIAIVKKEKKEGKNLTMLNCMACIIGCLLKE